MKPTLNVFNLLQKRSDRENKSKAYYPQQTEPDTELLNDQGRSLVCRMYSLTISQKLKPSIVVRAALFFRSNRVLLHLIPWMSRCGEWSASWNEALLQQCCENRGNESRWYSSCSIRTWFQFQTSVFHRTAVPNIQMAWVKLLALMRVSGNPHLHQYPWQK